MSHDLGQPTPIFAPEILKYSLLNTKKNYVQIH